MRIKITLLFCLLTISLTYGQYDWTKGKLVLKNGDTLKGQIKLPMISKNLVAFNGKEKVKYRKNRKSKKIKYDETKVEKVIFRNSDTEIAFFEYIPISKKKKGLFKVISSGKATLYARTVSMTSSTPMYMGGPNGGTWNHWNYSFSDFNEFYVLKEDEANASPLITARLSRSFKKRAMEYFSDCPNLVSKLDKRMYVKDDIKDVIDEYNECKEKTKYTLNDINKVVLEKKGTYFMKKNKKGDILITNLIYEGSPLSCYLYWEEGFNGQRSPSYYFQKGNENLKLIYRGLGNSSNKKMRKYFSDCPKLAEYIKSRTFETYVERSPKFKDKSKLNSKLIEIVKYYNENCQ